MCVMVGASFPPDPTATNTRTSARGAQPPREAIRLGHLLEQGAASANITQHTAFQ